MSDSQRPASNSKAPATPAESTEKPRAHKEVGGGGTKKDSLGLSTERSPWLVYALLQIPIVIIMIIVIYFLYEQSKM
jgi:hypothetical protein